MRKLRASLKDMKFHVLAFVCLLATVIGAISFVAYGSRAQSTKKESVERVKSTVRITERIDAVNVNATAFAEAASRNAGLRQELSWTFGGKPQRGWYLYDLLISKTLNTDDDTATTDFAADVAAWQKRKGLSGGGVLDEDALMALVSQWQASRLKIRTPATPDQLLTVSPAEFYDPTRAEELRQVERRTYEAYREMMAAATADLDLRPGEKYLKIVSAYRSAQYQEQLRKNSPNAGSAGLAVNSPHFTGRALDLYVGGDPVDTKDANRAIQVNTPAYRWLVRNAERFGFRPYFYEPWHWEYVR